MTNTIFKLTNYGLLKVAGNDAAKLLQGQLTCDIEKLANTSSCLGAHCQPQGRVISLFRLFQYNSAYYLLMPQSMIQTALEALKKYTVFYKVELTDASNSLTILGANGSIDPIHTNNDIKVISIPSKSTRHLIICTHDAAKEIEKNMRSQIEETNTWLSLDIQDGIPTIYPETSGIFLPHDINLPEMDAVSFDKGCFTGQEIIARMQYRGKLKNHMYYAKLSGTTLLTPGQDIYCLTNDNPVGKIVNSSPFDQHTQQALIIVDSSNAKNHHLYIDHEHKNYFMLEN